jgi:hypothetical protein
LQANKPKLERNQQQTCRRSQSLSLLLAIDIIRLNADDLTATDEWIELGAIPQLVPRTLAARSGSGPEADFVALQPGLAGLLVFDALVNDRAEVFEHTAPVAAETDILAATDVIFGAAAQPVCCAVGVLGTPGRNRAELVDSELRIPDVFGVEGNPSLAHDHWDGSGKRDCVGEDVGEEHCCGVVL